jgi:hypothetical protein
LPKERLDALIRPLLPFQDPLAFLVSQEYIRALLDCLLDQAQISPTERQLWATTDPI